MKQESHETIMQACIEAAKKSTSLATYPIAAAVVRAGAILALTTSKLIDGCDPSAHPEMEAVRATADLSRSRYLEGAILYSTLEPCPMCTSVAIWARMQGIVFGAFQEDAAQWVKLAGTKGGLRTWRQISISAQYVVERGEPKLWVRGGVLRQKCIELFSADIPTNT